MCSSDLGCGANNYGQLGLGYTGSEIPKPTEITFFNGINIIQIVGGVHHTIFLTNDGKVYSCGANNDGQLGLGYASDTGEIIIQEITYFSTNDINITNVECGEKHTIFVASNGKVYGCGFNSSGQLGLGNTTQQNTPVEITYFLGSELFSDVICGRFNTILVASDNKIYGCGYNGFGKFGLENTTNQSIPQEFTYFTNNAINIKQIASLNDHSMFLDTNGYVYGSGRNSNGELGLAYSTSNPQSRIQAITKFITHVVCGFNHSIFLADNGTIYSCGYNSNGELGIGTNNSKQSVPQEIIYFDAGISESDGGRGTNSEKINIVDIKCRSAHAMFIASDGKIYGCGYNGYGQLGINNITTQRKPQLIKYFEAGIAESDGGRGTDSEKINIKQVECGGYNTIFLTDDGKVYSCGQNSHGQLGIGDASISYKMIPQLIKYFEAGIAEEDGGRGIDSEKINIKQIDFGEFFIVFLTDDGKVYNCGRNNYGQLGNGNYGDGGDYDKYKPQEVTNLSGIIIKKIVCGRYVTIFLAEDGRIFGCGQNSEGQLGLEHIISPQPTPVEIKFFNNEYNNIPVANIACSMYCTFFLAEDGRVFSCGQNNYGQLGLGYIGGAISKPTEITSFYGFNIIQMVGGMYHTIFLTDDGKVYRFGHNEEGQLGLGHYIYPQTTPDYLTFFNPLIIKQISCGMYHTIFLTDDGKVYSCGRNDNGQLGIGDTTVVEKNTLQEITYLTDKNITYIDCGANYTFFLGSDGSVYGCGYNSSGQLGLGNNGTKYTPEKITFFNDNITYLSAGSAHTIFLTSDNHVYGCGLNGNGQLGVGDKNDRYTPIRIEYFDNINIIDVVCGDLFTMFIEDIIG